MDWGEFSAGDGRPSPRKELQLQGPRPTPLKVRKDSHKIKKPPIAPPYQPQYHHQQQHQQQSQLYQNQNQNQYQQQQRQPVIIYTVSPKVIHTDASEFMSLVQRLTGPNSSSSPTVSNSNSGAISPAARYATIEKTKMPLEGGDKSRFFDSMDTIIGDIEIGPHVERTGTFPGILSPMPSSLPIVSPNFFSPPSDQNSFNFLHDLSPLFQGNKNYFETAFMPSPNNSTFLPTPTALTSPNLSFDLFNQFLDF